MLPADINTPCIHQASVVKAVSPNYPRSLPPGLAAFAVVVNVTIGEEGSVKGATVYDSSGYPDADAAAIEAAKASTYTPKVVDCKPAESVYQLREVFSNSPFNLPPVAPRSFYTPPPASPLGPPPALRFDALVDRDVV
jgi:TonB family protein